MLQRRKGRVRSGLTFQPTVSGRGAGIERGVFYQANGSAWYDHAGKFGHEPRPVCSRHVMHHAHRQLK